MFRDAGRIAKMLAASDDTTPQKLAAVEEAMACFDQAGTLRLCHVELDRLAMGPLRTEVNAAYAALVQRDARSILAAAYALREATSFRSPPVIGASAALLLASIAFTPTQSPVTESLAEEAP
jgi:hypothetical protein